MDIMKSKISGILSEQRKFMSIRDAKKALDSNPDGGLYHEFLGEHSYVLKGSNGYRFYDVIDDKVRDWDWQEDSKACIKTAINDDTLNFDKDSAVDYWKKNWEYYSKEHVLQHLRKDESWWKKHVG